MTPINWAELPPSREQNEVTWALGRLPECTYANRSFILELGASRDVGHPARWLVKVFNETNESVSDEWEWEEHLVSESPAGRVQVKLQVAREAGVVRRLEIQKVPTTPGATRVTTLLTLDREGSARLIGLVRTLEHIPVEGERSVRVVDDSVIHELFTNPDQVGAALNRFRDMVRSDADARDVIALARRREVVTKMQTWLEDDDAFDAAAADAGGKEAAWQGLLEENPWILGLGLAGQLLTSWDQDRLEQVVAGFSVAAPGKRVDALMRTQGAIRTMVLAEIKHHRTELLVGQEYRPGCWSPSRELSGGVTQIQQTAHRTAADLRGYLPDRDDDGSDLTEGTYVVRPRTFLVVGHLGQLRGASGVHRDKHRSFELYRRNLVEPEILTFDELLARAEWHVSLADAEAQAEVRKLEVEEPRDLDEDSGEMAEEWDDGMNDQG